MGEREIFYSIVVPLYNEEMVINEAYRRLKSVMDYIEESYEIIFVNDGSRDRTLKIAKEICKNDNNVKLLSFSRNFGHQMAITAGMDNSIGKAVVVIDADLQDPPEVIMKMIEKWKQGYEVVYGKRTKRNGETFIKKFTAKVFYRTLKGITDVNIPVDTGDFRLIDRKVCDALKAIPEHNRYVRGLISWLGFKQTGVEFVREERFAGETKYPLKKMIRFAMDAITSFSYKPLRLPAYIGTAIMALGSFQLIFTGIQKLLTAKEVSSLSLIIALMLFFNGFMLITLGITGEYIGRICDETKGRPLYIISEKDGFNAKVGGACSKSRTV